MSARFEARVVAVLLAVWCVTGVVSGAGAAAAASRAKPRVAAAKPAAPPEPASPANPTETASRNAWQEARRLSDEKRFDEALAVLEQALKRDPDDVDLLWLRAGATGWAGRHAQAVKLYEALIASHPEMADRVSEDLAHERELAIETASQEAWQEARRLADAERYDDALIVLEKALKREPDNVDLLWLRAGVTGWADRHEEAVKLYEALIAAHPDMADVVRLDLAQERYKSGALDAAVRDLDRYLTVHSDDREARRLRDLAISNAGPGLTVSRQRADDSDALRLISEALEYYHPVGLQNVMLVVMGRDHGSNPFGERTASRLGVGHERSWSRRWSSHLIAQVHDQGGGHASQGMVDAGVAWRPRSGLRLDLGAERRALVEPEALALDIMSWTLAMAADWDPHPRVAVGLARRQISYSDDNYSVRHSLSVTTPLMRRENVRAWLSGNFEHVESDEELPHGYYDPLHYVEYGPELELEWDPPGAWNLDLTGNLGRQREDHGDSKPSAGISVRGQMPLSHLFNLGLELFRSDSNIETGGGYERRGWSVDLTTRF